MDTTALIQEPEIPIEEGVVTLLLKETNTEGKYNMEIKLEYDNIEVKLDSSFANPFVGTYTALIKHSGEFTPSNKPIIIMKMT